MVIHRTKQGLGPPENPTRPGPTRQVLGGSENIQVRFWVLISGNFWVQLGIRSGVGSYKYTSLNSIFSFEKNPTLLFSLRLPQLSGYLCVSHPSHVVLFVCVWYCCCVCVCLIYLSLCVLKMGNRVREQGVSVREGTRPTHYVWGVAAVVSIFRRVAARKRTCMPPPFSLSCINLCKYIFV